MRSLWQAAPSLATAQFIIARYQELRTSLPLTPLRVDIERSFTIEPVTVVLRAKAYLHGFDLDVRVGGFDAVASEMLDAASALYARESNVVIVAVQTRSVAPDLWSDYTSLSAEEVEAAIQRVIEQYRSWIQTFRSHSRAHLLVHTLDAPAFPSTGLLNVAGQLSQRDAIARINAGLQIIAAATPGVHLLDYDRLVARHGQLSWEDPVRWATMRMPLTAESVVHLADEWLRFLHPITGRVAKVLVCDLDNTLWGGVLGDEGTNGIKIGADYPGSAFQSLQRAILDLYHRGIVLAISSKNEHADAVATLANHPGILLRPDHFAAMRINWNDKATHLREIAAELNVGTDALAFLDDNPHEREWVRSQMPEVCVIDLPAEPALYERTLREQPVFERLALTDEDRRRSAMYAEQRQRHELQQHCQTLEDYYRSLELVVQIEPVGPETLERAAQLIGKTNQFNLTGKRFSAQELAGLVNSPDGIALVARVRDRFGDSGIVGAIAGRVEDGQRLTIDAFVMSCRVIGRTVETAMLAGLCEYVSTRGIRRLDGLFIPTAKNGPARDFYARHGFTQVSGTEVESHWQLDLSRGGPACPPWIDLRVPQEVCS
jgi:FkbH-like protein